MERHPTLTDLLERRENRKQHGQYSMYRAHAESHAGAFLDW